MMRIIRYQIIFSVILIVASSLAGHAAQEIAISETKKNLVPIKSVVPTPSAPGIPSFLIKFPKTTYHKFVSGNETIGRTSFRWAVDQGLIAFDEDAEMKLMLFKKEEKIRTKSRTWTNQELEIQRLNFEMQTSTSLIKIEGERLGSNLRLTITQAGKTQRKDLPFEEPLLVSGTIRPFLLMKGLKESGHWETKILEPSALTSVPMVMNVKKSQKNTWSVDVHYLQHHLFSEVLEDGSLKLEKSDFAGMPVEAKPISADVYKSLLIQGTKRDLVEIAKVPFVALPKARELKSLSVKISGVDLAGFELNRLRQKLVGNVLKVKVETLPRESLPVQSLIGQKGFEKYLQSDASMPVFDPLIQKTAKEIVGEESNLWKRALLVHRFVNSHLEKTPTVSIPNALEVLESKKGDCNEHAILFTALARAAGIPARTVVGLVYSDRMYRDQGFYYHAWVEVYSGKEWISMDPTWNQIPADATHLAFVEGGLDQQVQVTSLMGRIKLSLVSSEPPSL